MGSTSLMRNWTWAPCFGSAESQPLDHQRSPKPWSFFFFFKKKKSLVSRELKPHQTEPPCSLLEKKQSSTRVTWITWPETPGQFLPSDTNPHPSPQRHVEEGRNSIRRPRIRKEKRFQLLLKVFTFAKALWSGLSLRKSQNTHEKMMQRDAPQEEK